MDDQEWRMTNVQFDDEEAARRAKTSELFDLMQRQMDGLREAILAIEIKRQTPAL